MILGADKKRLPSDPVSRTGLPDPGLLAPLNLAKAEFREFDGSSRGCQ